MRMANDKISINDMFSNTLILEPTAYAVIQGSPLAPELSGRALFYQLSDGIIIRTLVTGIPKYTSDGKPSFFLGYHIHEFGNCNIGDPTSPFIDSGGHWNPTNEPHPYHYGDLSPLMYSNGMAAMNVYLSRFSVNNLIGKSIIIHENADDFTTQPSGNSGNRLACGVIMES